MKNIMQKNDKMNACAAERTAVRDIPAIAVMVTLGPIGTAALLLLSAAL